MWFRKVIELAPNASFLAFPYLRNLYTHSTNHQGTIYSPTGPVAFPLESWLESLPDICSLRIAFQGIRVCSILPQK